jgi:hypothetical protein
MLPEVERLTNPICDRYHVPQTSMHLPTRLGVEGMTGMPKDMVDTESVLGGVSNFVSVLGAILVTSALGGGGGIALLTHGPVGALMLIIIGGVAWYVGKVGMENLLKNMDMPSFLRTFVSENRVRGELRDKESEFAKSIRDSLAANMPAFRKLLDTVHDSITEALYRAADRAALLIR